MNNENEKAEAIQKMKDKNILYIFQLNQVTQDEIEKKLSILANEVAEDVEENKQDIIDRGMDSKIFDLEESIDIHAIINKYE